jgi:[protein-PII] uridylyltransferase
VSHTKAEAELAGAPPVVTRVGLTEARARAATHLASGGVDACHALSDALDEAVLALVAQVGPPSAMALLATGGWGRRETCLYSDIDLLVLTPGPPDGAARELAERLLYPLWDAGLEVGHAVRSVAEAADLAGEDLATMTALLDARLLCGQPGLAGELARVLPQVLVRRGANAFVNRLISEKQSRHAKFGDSLFLLEPNLKHGLGGLRDLATGLWAARARWRVRDFPELVAIGQASARQAAALTAARELLLQLRGFTHAPR